MLRVFGVVGLCLALGWCAPASARAGVGTPEPRPVALLLPSGGFIFQITEMRYPMQAARRLGFSPRVVTYPNFDLPGAVRAVRAAAREAGREGREVYVYGESAGGVLAALLAQDRLAVAASTYCPIADLAGFIDQSWDPGLYMDLIRATAKDLRRYSPGLRDSGRPILAMRGVDDAPFMNGAIRRWDRRDPELRSVAVAGGHLRDPDRPALYRRNVRRGLAWLARSAGLEPSPG